MSKTICSEHPHLRVDDVLACYRKDITGLSGGTIPFRRVWERVCSELKIPSSEDFMLRVLRTAPWNEEMFGLVLELKTSYRIGMITDNSVERLQVLSNDRQLDALFDPVIISAAEKASKSDGSTMIFDIALERAGAKADESVFIDNQQRNLTTPEKMGMKTYFFDHAKKDVAALREALREMGMTGV